MPANSVTFDQVTRGKPFPEPFILGADRLGLQTDQCWAIEDAPGGVTSAKERWLHCRWSSNNSYTRRVAACRSSLGTFKSTAWQSRSLSTVKFASSPPGTVAQLVRAPNS